MIAARRGIGALAAAVLMLAGCSTLRHRSPSQPTVLVNGTPPAMLAWGDALDSVRVAVRAKRFADADSLLTRFSEQHTGTASAGESLFWRAILRLDPDNRGASPRDALRAVDAYLAGGPLQRHYYEARVLRRTVSLLDSLDTIRNVSVSTDSATAARDKARDDELARLKLELEKVTAELDRIKRRLVSPRP
jgi:hypothetical protein